MTKLHILPPFLIALSGCITIATVPMASSKEDEQAKQLKAESGTANVYIYRGSSAGLSSNAPITLSSGPRHYSLELSSGSFYVFKNIEPGNYNVSVGATWGQFSIPIFNHHD